MTLIPAAPALPDLAGDHQRHAELQQLVALATAVLSYGLAEHRAPRLNRTPVYSSLRRELIRDKRITRSTVQPWPRDWP